MYPKRSKSSLIPIHLIGKGSLALPKKTKTQKPCKRPRERSPDSEDSSDSSCTIINSPEKIQKQEKYCKTEDGTPIPTLPTMKQVVAEHLQKEWMNKEEHKKLVSDCAYTLAHEFYTKPLYIKAMYVVAKNQGDVILDHWDCTRQSCDIHEAPKHCPATNIAIRVRYLLNNAFKENKLDYPEEYNDPAYYSQLTEDCLADRETDDYRDTFPLIWKKLNYRMFNNKKRPRKQFPRETTDYSAPVKFKIQRPTKNTQ